VSDDQEVLVIEGANESSSSEMGIGTRLIETADGHKVVIIGGGHSYCSLASRVLETVQQVYKPENIENFIMDFKQPEVPYITDRPEFVDFHQKHLDLKTPRNLKEKFRYASKRIRQSI
jgi:hypothetical protein